MRGRFDQSSRRIKGKSDLYPGGLRGQPQQPQVDDLTGHEESGFGVVSPAYLLIMRNPFSRQATSTRVPH
jgi:hypothetical protein